MEPCVPTRRGEVETYDAPVTAQNWAILSSSCLSRFPRDFTAKCTRTRTGRAMHRDQFASKI